MTSLGRSCKISRALLVVIVPLCVVFTSCGRSEEEALLELQRNGAHFTQPDFAKAISQGDVEVVELFLDGGMDVDAPMVWQGDRTPLVQAALSNQVSVVKLLLKRGAHVDGASSGSASPLTRVATTDLITVAEALLDGGADPNRRSGEGGTTPLHRAARHGNAEMVRTLLDAGADPRLCDGLGSTPLGSAIRGGNNDAFDELLKRSDRAVLNSVCDAGLPVMVQAIAFEQREMALSLLEAGADPGASDRNGRAPLTAALERKYDDLSIAIVRRMSEHDPETVQRSLAEAVLWGRAAVVHSMIESDGKIDELDARTRLFWAALSGQVPLAEEARDDGAGIGAFDARDFTVLESAAEAGHLNIVSWALERQLGVYDFRRRAPAIYLAANNGHLDIVERLLQAGANPDQRTFRRNTALMAACRRGDLPTVQLLLRHNADPNLGAPLILAVAAGAEDIVRQLLDAGANVNAGKEVGVTPILVAAENEDVELALMLLDAGADPTILGKDGVSAALIAARRGDERLASLIRPAKGATRGDSWASSKAREEGIRALFEAVYRDDGEAIGRLIAAGVSADSIRRGGDSALWVAVNLRKLQAVRALLAGGATVDEGKLFYGSNHRLLKGNKTLLMQAADRIEADSSAMSREEFLAAGREFRRLRPSPEPDLDQPKIVRLLLAAGAPLNSRDDDGKTALIYASSFGSPETVDVLLAAGAEVNSRSKYGVTALHVASKRGDIAIVRALLNSGADPAQQNRRRESPVMIAERAGHKEVAALLCEQPGVRCLEWEEVTARVDDPAASPKTNRAVSPGDEEVAYYWIPGAKSEQVISDQLQQGKLNEYLKRVMNANDVEAVAKALDAGADPSSRVWRRFPALIGAAERRQHRIMTLLLEAGADANCEDSNGSTALHRAVLAGDPAGVRLLLKAGANIDKQNDRGECPLHTAIGGTPEVVRALVDARADVNCRDANGLTPVSFAADDPATLQILLDERPWFSGPVDVNVPIRGCHVCTPLMAAVRNVDSVKRLLKAGAKVNVRDPQGRTPLILAAQKGVGAAIPVLIDAGADLEARSTDGRTALAHAAAHGSSEVISLLARAGADVNTVDLQGLSPMMITFGDQYVGSPTARRAVTLALLDLGVSMEHADATGRTPLIAAVRACDAKLVTVLLRRGALVGHADHSGRTALHYAVIGPENGIQRTGYWTIIQELVGFGADVTAQDHAGDSPIDLVGYNSSLEDYLRDVANRKFTISGRRVLK